MLFKPENDWLGSDIAESEPHGGAKVSAVASRALHLFGQQRAKGFRRCITFCAAALRTHGRDAALNKVLTNILRVPFPGRQLTAAEGAAPSELLAQRFPFTFCKIHVIPCLSSEFVPHLSDACHVMSVRHEQRRADPLTWSGPAQTALCHLCVCGVVRQGNPFAPSVG